MTETVTRFDQSSDLETTFLVISFHSNGRLAHSVVGYTIRNALDLMAVIHIQLGELIRGEVNTWLFLWIVSKTLFCFGRHVFSMCNLWRFDIFLGW